MPGSTIDTTGRPRMVDVGAKPETARTAVAEGRIRMSSQAYQAVAGNLNPKGDVLSTVELAGTTGAKRTADLIPLCHPIGLDHVEVNATLAPDLPGVHVVASVSSVGRTGVEMEALTAVSVALLTVYDMVKAAGHEMEIQEVRLLSKTGGVKGDWKRTENEVH